MRSYIEWGKGPKEVYVCMIELEKKFEVLELSRVLQILMLSHFIVDRVTEITDYFISTKSQKDLIRLRHEPPNYWLTVKSRKTGDREELEIALDAGTFRSLISSSKLRLAKTRSYYKSQEFPEITICLDKILFLGKEKYFMEVEILCSQKDLEKTKKVLNSFISTHFSPKIVKETQKSYLQMYKEYLENEEIESYGIGPGGLACPHGGL